MPNVFVFDRATPLEPLEADDIAQRRESLVFTACVVAALVIGIVIGKFV
jgi:hypothetical protein